MEAPDRKQRLLDSRIRVVVLDDDPTGIQTVQGCLVLTEWSEETLTTALADEAPYFYLLTNTRAHRPERVRQIIAEATQNLIATNAAFGYRLVFICRSDSTLRSHFPLEIDTVSQQAGIRPDARFLIPAFFEGNRITTGDTHYVRDGERLTPCHETEFAQDTAFGYSTAYLPGYIEEKTNGRVRQNEVISLPGELLQKGRQPELADFMDRIKTGGWVIVNATSYEALDPFSDQIVTRLGNHAAYLFQSAASFVKSLVDCPHKAALGAETRPHRGPGLVVVGSHVDKTSRQLKRLLTAPGVAAVEIDISRLIDDGKAYFSAISHCINQILAEEKTPVVFTARRLMRFADTTAQLDAGQRISSFLSGLVAAVEIMPSFLIAKGGITSHDVLMTGLGISRARVLGQAAPGIPVIRMPSDHRWARMPYIIFPGNVGENEALLDVYRKFSGIG